MSFSRLPAGIVLVVPKPIHENCHDDIRSELWSLEQFISNTQQSCSAKQAPPGMPETRESKLPAMES